MVWRGLDTAAVTRFSQQVQQSPDHLTVGGFTQQELESAVRVKGGRRATPPGATPGTV